MPNKTNITPPRVPLTDTRTGLVSREWYQFFLSLFNLTGAGQSSLSLTELAKSIITDHGHLNGLADDDHPQYLKTTVFDETVDELKKGTGVANYVIAAPDSPTELKSRADFVYDPTTDVINTCIENIKTTGGLIKLLPGTYEIRENNWIFKNGTGNVNNVTIQGSGPSTVFRINSGSSNVVFKFTDNRSYYGITLEDFNVVGFGRTAGGQFIQANRPANCIIDGLTLRNINVSSISYLNVDAAGGCSLNNVVFDGCKFVDMYGFSISCSTVNGYNGKFIDTTFNNTSEMYFAGLGTFLISGCKFDTNAELRLDRCNSTPRVLIVGNTFKDCSPFGIWSACQNVVIASNYFVGCGAVNSPGWGFSASIYVQPYVYVMAYPNPCTIIGNTIVRPATNPGNHYGIRIDSADCFVDGNNIVNAGYTSNFFHSEPVGTFGIPDESITNAMLAGSIALSKLATDPLARANHTGTQAASTISDLATVVKGYRLDEFANPTASVSMNSQKITSLATPETDTDAATKAYADTAITTANGAAEVAGAVADDLSEHVGATGTAHGEATTETAGFMPADAVTKLGGIEAGANAYTHPASHAASMITEDETHRFVTDDEKTTWNAGATADMLKSTYDTNDDGKVNAADVADAAPWSGITDKPSTFPPEAHTHPYEPELGNPTGDYQVAASMASGERLWGKPTGITFTDDSYAFLDSAAGAKAVTVAGTVTVDTTHQLTGSSCLAFGGGYLTVADSDDWFLDTLDFTIDARVNLTNTGSSQYVFCQGVDTSNYMFLSVASNRALTFACSSGGSSRANYQYTVPVEFYGTGHTIRISRSGSNLYLFIDGIKISWTAAVPISTNSLPNFASSLAIGARSFDPRYAVTGYLDEFRWSVGICRSTATYTVSSEPAVADEYDKLLLNCDNELRVLVPAAMVQESTTKRFVSDTEKATWNGKATVDGHAIKDESTLLTQRTNISFQGGGVTATDDAANDQTIVTVPTSGGTQTTLAYASATNNTAQTMSAAAWNKILFQTVGTNVGSRYSGSTSKFTANKTCRIRMSVFLTGGYATPSDTARRVIQLRKNNSQIVYNYAQFSYIGKTDALFCSWEFEAVANDYFECYLYMEAGNAWTTGGSESNYAVFEEVPSVVYS